MYVYHRKSHKTNVNDSDEHVSYVLVYIGGGDLAFDDLLQQL